MKKVFTLKIIILYCGYPQPKNFALINCRLRKIETLYDRDSTCAVNLIFCDIFALFNSCLVFGKFVKFYEK